jgi:hypothetical protein
LNYYSRTYKLTLLYFKEMYFHIHSLPSLFEKKNGVIFMTLLLMFTLVYHHFCQKLEHMIAIKMWHRIKRANSPKTTSCYSRPRPMCLASYFYQNISKVFTSNFNLWINACSFLKLNSISIGHITVKFILYLIILFLFKPSQRFSVYT